MPKTLSLKVSLGGRYALRNFLPGFGSIQEVLDIRAIGQVLEPTDEEKKRWQIREGETPGSIVWNPAIKNDSTIKLTPEQWLILRLGAELLDAQKKFPAQEPHLSVYQDICKLLDKNQ